ncbi:acyl-CoA dehydrogenase family protein [Mycobacterium arosiense]|uniref:Acyl-CoA dehydrogenase n=1 Tax=Mycobacterium arosiense ATCC BAA-1401 = DSM 45069 TaxID=1265311 RepID=A0A1W9ZQ36_MYCAI|nr:acyl-CoA dehydrogenase family protein [Mycobacterium arosiense]ORA19934.1 acyl-CoA dehydrogenase [Mycobacterium arosiense ATCC BAA-1401 = DSM 45069]
MTAFSTGVFATDTVNDEHAELRQLVDDIGRRSFDARLGQRRIPEQFDAELWRNLEDTGLARLTSTADLGAGPPELAIALSGIARHAGAVPLAETDALAGWLGNRAGIELPEGPLTVAIADADASGGRVRGTTSDVAWTRACAAVLLLARSPDEARVGVVDIRDARLVESHNLAGEPRDRLTFDVAADEFAVVEPAVADELSLRGSWCRCVQVVGALDAAAAMSVTHTRERIQFGRPLSKFQSVQHALAAMAGEIERARAATTLAVAAAAEYGFSCRETEFAIVVARVAVGRAVRSVTTIAHQLHGAIGVTAEHPLSLVTLRAQSWCNDYDTTAGYARRLGRMALTAADPWDLVIGNFRSVQST